MEVKRLYHYTNLASLECILRNRTIRFNSLKNVNDKYEGETQDIGNIGKYLFVSCWNADEQESEMMWEKYGDNYKGVRISFPLPIFNEYYDENVSDQSPSVVSLDDSFGKNHFILPTINNEFIFKVKYSDDFNDLNPDVKMEFSDGIKALQLGKTGKIKSTFWKYENEYRFLIQIIPTSRLTIDNFSINKLGESVTLMNNDIDLGFDNYDVKINEQCFSSMEIIYGKNISERNLNFIRELLQIHNTSSKLVPSSKLSHIT